MPDHVEETLSPADRVFGRQPQTEPSGPAFESTASGAAIEVSEPLLDAPMHGLSEKVAQARSEIGWGSRYKPEIPHESGRRKFQQLCGGLSAELAQLDDFLVDGIVEDEASGVLAEIADLLERLYDCPFDEGDGLKAAVVAIQSQVNNARWTDNHVEFVKEAIKFLRVRSVIGDQEVRDIDDMSEEYGLDVFRGTVTEPEVRQRYRIERVG